MVPVLPPAAAAPHSHNFQGEKSRNLPDSQQHSVNKQRFKKLSTPQSSSQEEQSSLEKSSLEKDGKSSSCGEILTPDHDHVSPKVKVLRKRRKDLKKYLKDTNAKIASVPLNRISTYAFLFFILQKGWSLKIEKKKLKRMWSTLSCGTLYLLFVKLINPQLFVKITPILHWHLI